MMSAALLHVWQSLGFITELQNDLMTQYWHLKLCFWVADARQKLPEWTLYFTPTHSQTVLCPDPPCDPSTMTPACCCRGPARFGRSGQAEREAAAPGVRWNTGPFPARSVPPWAAAPSVPWRTRTAIERRGHNLQPSNLCRSCWNSLKLNVIQNLQNMALD